MHIYRLCFMFEILIKVNNNIGGYINIYIYIYIYIHIHIYILPNNAQHRVKLNVRTNINT